MSDHIVWDLQGIVSPIQFGRKYYSDFKIERRQRQRQRQNRKGAEERTPWRTSGISVVKISYNNVTATLDK